VGVGGCADWVESLCVVEVRASKSEMMMGRLTKSFTNVCAAAMVLLGSRIRWRGLTDLILAWPSQSTHLQPMVPTLLARHFVHEALVRKRRGVFKHITNKESDPNILAPNCTMRADITCYHSARYGNMRRL
jgi:hypothetical protein